MITVLNIIALFINMIGLVLIFRYGISPMTPKSGRIYLYQREALEKQNTPMHEKERRYKRLSVLGLYLSLLGMAMQMLLLLVTLF